MPLISFIERVLDSGILNPDLVRIAQNGASAEELSLAPPLPRELHELLVWKNGLDLEVIRIHGVGNVTPHIMYAEQITGPDDVLFASDPAGFQYVIRPDETVVCYDHDGGETTAVALSFDDFIRGYIFGPRAADFGGDEWAWQVKGAIGLG